MGFSKSLKLLLFFHLLLGYCASTSAAREKEQFSIPQAQGRKAYPDGRIGTLNLKPSGSSTTATSEGSLSERDIETYTLRAGFVAFSRLTVFNQIELRERLGRRYQWSTGLRFYWLDPDYHRGHINPDGPVGGPTLDISGGVRFLDDPGGRGLAVGDVALSVPLSSHLTGGVGYRMYDQREPLDALSLYGTINLFFADYSSGYEWDNPDGVSGHLVVRLIGGGSSNGYLVQGQVLLPLDPTVTLSTRIRYELLDDSSYRAYSAGAGLAWYPSH